MREYRGPGGDRRLWFDPREIDDLMVDELRRADLLPDASRTDLSVDVEAFVESYLGLPFDLSAELEVDVLGMTAFVPGRRPKISINRDLTESAFDREDTTPGLVGRWRATVAHEACHVLLHRILFESPEEQSCLFPAPDGGGEPSHLMRCLKRDVGFERPVSDWREVQANMGMGALLMPKPVFLAAFDEERERVKATHGRVAEGSPKHERLASLLAARFAVSRQAARIRLTTLKGVKSADQLDL